MTRYSVQPRDRIFVRDYVFLSFSEIMSKKIGKHISKSLSGKCSQKLLDHAKKSATDAIKFLQKEPFKKQQKQLVV